MARGTSGPSTHDDDYEQWSSRLYAEENANKDAEAHAVSHELELPWVATKEQGEPGVMLTCAGCHYPVKAGEWGFQSESREITICGRFCLLNYYKKRREI